MSGFFVLQATIDSREGRQSGRYTPVRAGNSSYRT